MYILSLQLLPFSRDHVALRFKSRHFLTVLKEDSQNIKMEKLGVAQVRSYCIQRLTDAIDRLEQLSRNIMNCNCHKIGDKKFQDQCQCSRFAKSVFTVDEFGDPVLRSTNPFLALAEFYDTIDGSEAKRYPGNSRVRESASLGGTSSVFHLSSMDAPSLNPEHEEMPSMPIVIPKANLVTTSFQDDLAYSIKKGYLLTISNVNFSFSPVPRYTVESDNIAIQSFFKDKAGFTIDENHDLTMKQMEEKFKSFAFNEDLENYDCFVAVVSSHGSKDGILGTDSVPCKVEKLVNMVRGDKCKALIGKPKLFFVEACRGRQKDPGQLYLARGPSSIVPDSPDSLDDSVAMRIPTDSDILVVYATTPGRLAYGYTTLPFEEQVEGVGSWFLSTLMEVFTEYSKTEDISTMLIRVNNRLSQYGNEESRKQISCQMSMLRNKVYFVV